MKRNIIILAGLMIISLAAAQKKTDAMLFGDVREKGSSNHIPFATVQIKGTTTGTTTDVSGHFKMANLPVGNHIIVAQSMGYKPQEKVVQLEEGKSLTLIFELEEDVFTLEQLVVTGTRTAHQVKDAPIRTEVITAKKIETNQSCNIYEALEGTPGIRVESQCQSCNFTMVRMQGLGAEHTQVLINGQPVYSGLAGVFGLEQMSTIDLDRIEVVKGAGSALYGSSAIAGAINLISKEPSFVPYTRLLMQYGSHHSSQFGISSSIRNEKGNIGLNVYAQRTAEDAIDETGAGTSRKEVNQADGLSDRVATKLNNAGFGLHINDLGRSRDKLIIRGRITQEQRNGGTMEDDYYLNPFTDGTERILTNRYEGEASYTLPLRGSEELKINLTYVNHHRDATNDTYLLDYMAMHQDSTPDLREMRPYLARENAFSSNVSYSLRTGAHQWLIGAQLHYSLLNESGLYVNIHPDSPFLGTSYRSTSRKEALETGAYLQSEWSLGEKWLIVPGVRMDYHQSGEEYAANRKILEVDVIPATSLDRVSVNPRLAIRYNHSDELTFRFNAGRGYRAPYGFSEDLHLCSGSPRVWKSSGLDPETSISFNASSDYYGKRMRLSINIFRTELYNKIGFGASDPAVAAMGYDYQWRNIDDAYVQGVEISSSFSIRRRLDLGIDFTLNEGKYKHAREDWEGTEFAGISQYISRFPGTTGNVNLEYTPKSWSFLLTSSYQGRMYIDYYNTDIDEAAGDLSKIKITRPFMLFNARIAKDMGIFRLQAGVNNIFNYIQDERHMDDAAFLYAPIYGRLFNVGVIVRITH